MGHLWARHSPWFSTRTSRWSSITGGGPTGATGCARRPSSATCPSSRRPTASWPTASRPGGRSTSRPCSRSSSRPPSSRRSFPSTTRTSGAPAWIRGSTSSARARRRSSGSPASGRNSTSGCGRCTAGAQHVRAGHPVSRRRDCVPLRTAQGEPASAVPGTEARSPCLPSRVASRGGTGTAVAFFRDPKTTLQVWSREHGYPGEYAYLEFHKKHFPGGLRFWRITDHSGDLGRKQVYDPGEAAQKVGLQARHFVELVRTTLAQAGASGPAVGWSPYDAELFGHWWFAGPRGLQQLARRGERARGPS